jgi:hypothetical protein
MTASTWAEFDLTAPDLTAAALQLVTDRGNAGGPLIAYLATVRKDGGPRLHPVCPVVGGVGLCIFVSATSPRRRDLAGDGRFALHAPLGPNDEELVLTGVADRITDPARRSRAEHAARHTIHADDWCFELLVARCFWSVWHNVGQPDTQAMRRRWESS